MVDKYRTKSTSRQSFEIEKIADDGEFSRDIVLSEGAIHRKALRALILRNPKNPLASAKIDLIHQRKSSKSEWEDVESINLNTLKAGEGVRLSLDSETTLKLFEELRKIYEVAGSGEVQMGECDLIVAKVGEIIKTDAGKAEIFKKMLEGNHPEEFWESLAEEQPDLATKLAYARMQTDRREALEEFEKSLSEDRDELYWQDFFNRNQWIFGYGLKYQFLNQITGQPNFGGVGYEGTGGQRGDFLMNSEAEKKFTVLVEIKKPDTVIIKDDQYRNGVYKLGEELLWSVSQVQSNCETWNRVGSRTDQAVDQLEAEDIFTCRPKGILIIGQTSQLDSRDKQKVFESFRRELNNPRILTFDELFERAKFIVEQGLSLSESSSGEGAVPYAVEHPDLSE